MSNLERLKLLAEQTKNKMVMIELTKHEKVSVRFQLLNNEKIGREVLQLLMEDELQLIRNEAKRVFIKKVRGGEL